MLSFSVVGCGAAGNKAVIDLMNIGYNPDKCYLMNTTLKDIPIEYHDKVTLFGKSTNRLGGCGKERSIGKDMLLSDLRNNVIDIDRIVDHDDQAIVLVSSTEGGSGSSAVPILAKYFKKVHNMNVICVFFFGFNDDVRGMKNSIELCKELSEEYTVIGISNSKFLNGTNKFNAERSANELFCNIIKILSGVVIQAGSQIMDDTDLYKVVTTPGYLIANTWNFQRPKTPEAYHKEFMNFLNTQGFVDPSKNPGAKRIAMIFNAPEDENIDYSAQDLRTLYGEPFEYFSHLSEGCDVYSVSFIVSGMKLPAEEINSIYEEYMERTTKVSKERDSFFDMIGSMEASEDERGFDMLTPSNQKTVEAAKNDFFADMLDPEKKEAKSTFEY